VSEGNDKGRWAALSALVAGCALRLGLGSGWVAAVRTDAAFQQRTETFLDESGDYGSDISDLKTAVAVNNQQILALTRLVNDLQESNRRLGDKIDLLVQSQMREGRIAR
jgi:hypothetical protein